MTAEHDTEVLLVNLGTPAEPTAPAVKAFLRQFLSDPMVVDRPARWIWLPILHGVVLRKRPPVVAELYRSIWEPGGSPLAVQTEALARAVGEEVGEAVRVTAAYRYGDPPLARRVAVAARRARRVVVVPLFPQPTASSSGTVARAAEEAGERGGLASRLRILALAPDDPGYVEALAERYREAVRRDGGEEPGHLLFSFHGIPERVDREEHQIYSRACRRTMEAVCAALGRQESEATLCFQSRFGREVWLGPATDRTLAELPGRGISDLAILTPGFLTEGLETLEEIELRGRATFEGAGGRRLVRIPAPGDHPALARGLARLVQEGGGEKRGQP